MGAALILAAAAGALALLLLAVRLWVVLSPRAPVPRRSLSLLVVAGSGEYTGLDWRTRVGNYKTQIAPRRSSTAPVGLFGALNAEICSLSS